MRRSWRPPLLALVAVALAVLACGSTELTAPPAPTAAPDPLDGSSWVARLVDGRAPIAGREPTISFTLGKAGGNTGCNTWGATYRMDGAAIEFEEIESTTIGCEPGVSEVELAFLRALGSVARAAIDDQGRLVLEGGDRRLVFERGAPTPA